MFLRKMTVYQLARPITIADLNDFEKALSYRAERPIGKLEMACDGFVKPVSGYRQNYCLVVGRRAHDWYSDKPDEFARTAFPLMGFDDGNGSEDLSAALMLTFYREEKVLVAQDIKRKVQARVSELESSEARRIGPRERNEIRAAVTASILPHAQTRYWTAPILFCNNGLIIVGETSRRAEAALNELRAVLGTLPVQPVAWKNQIPFTLTQLARAQAYGEAAEDRQDYGFRIVDDFQMQELEEHPEIARMKNADIANEHVQNWMDEGKVVTHADLVWDNQVLVRVDPKGVFSKVRAQDATLEKVAELEEDEGDYNVGQATFASLMIEVAAVVGMLEAFANLSGGVHMPTNLEGRPTLDAEPTVLRNLADSIDNRRVAQGGDDEEADEEADE